MQNLSPKYIVTCIVAVALACISFAASSMVTTYVSAQDTTPTPTPSSIHLPIVRHSYPTGVYLMRNRSSWVSGGTLYVVGEIYNNTTSTIQLNEVFLDVFDANGRLLDTTSDYLWSLVSPGWRACFRVQIPEPPGWSYYELSGTYYANVTTSKVLSIFNDSGSLTYPGHYEVIGQIRNNHTGRVNSVEALVTLYDASNTVVDCGDDYVNGYDIDPGQARSFKVAFYSRPYTDVVSYRISAQCYLSD